MFNYFINASLLLKEGVWGVRDTTARARPSRALGASLLWIRRVPRTAYPLTFSQKSSWWVVNHSYHYWFALNIWVFYNTDNFFIRKTNVCLLHNFSNACINGVSISTYVSQQRRNILRRQKIVLSVSAHPQKRIFATIIVIGWNLELRQFWRTVSGNHLRKRTRRHLINCNDALVLFGICV